MERETDIRAGHAQDDAAVLPEWKAFAREFPQWYVWRGVAGQYYARVPRIQPAAGGPRAEHRRICAGRSPGPKTGAPAGTSRVTFQGLLRVTASLPASH